VVPTNLPHDDTRARQQHQQQRKSEAEEDDGTRPTTSVQEDDAQSKGKTGHTTVKTSQAPSRWDIITTTTETDPPSPSTQTDSNNTTNDKASPSSPTPSSSPPPDDTDDSKALLRKSSKRKMQTTNSQNPLLASGHRGRYVGNHFSQNRTFIEVKMVRTSPPSKGRGTSSSSSSKTNEEQRARRGKTTRDGARVLDPLNRRQEVRKKTSSMIQQRRTSPHKLDVRVALPVLPRKSNFLPRELKFPAIGVGGSSVQRSPGLQPRRRAASLAAEACLAMRSRK